MARIERLGANIPGILQPPIMQPKLEHDEALRWLRSQTAYRGVVEDAYWHEDPQKAATLFSASAEFKEVRLIAANSLVGATVLDLGAGRGIASWTFVEAGAALVYALEPSPSREVGRGAIAMLCAGKPVRILDGMGESIPLPDKEVDLVYARQVLHHTKDLTAVLLEVARVLKPGGLFVCCREHVVDNERQLRVFLDNHIMHRLAGGENAYRLSDYRTAIQRAGLRLDMTIGPWQSVINAFPAVHSNDQLREYPRKLLISRFGTLGRYASQIPGVNALVWARLNRPVPGRPYSFVARKPVQPIPNCETQPHLQSA